MSIGRAEAIQAVELLSRARLVASDWTDVAVVAERAADATRAGDHRDLGDATARLANLAFRSRVRARTGTGARRGAPVVAPARATPILPVVGAVCGSVVVALGWALGGVPLLAATALLGIGVLVVAVAGSHAVVRRRQLTADPDPDDMLVGAPATVARALDELHGLLSAAE